jgi:glycosyltransferase involved in cell wall biosynthesis
MKFLFLTSGHRTPSTRFRAIPFVDQLRKEGHQCTLSHSFPEKYDYFPLIGFRPSQLLKRYRRYLDILRAKWGRYDAVILERELFDNPTWDMETRLRKYARVMVLDMDDGVFLKFPEKFQHLLEMSDLVIAGNEWLRQWATDAGRPSVVIPTCIDTAQYRPRTQVGGTQDKRPVIGWMGTSGNIAYLRVLEQPLRNLAQTLEFDFQVIATDRGILDDLALDGVNVVFRKWNPETEATDILNFDIGVMPLTDDPWSKYKCGLKLLQYMAIGIPGVASPVGVNREIIREGENGFLADSATQWEAALRKLIMERELRSKIGANARTTVEHSYSVSANLPKWLEAIRRTIETTPQPPNHR